MTEGSMLSAPAKRTKPRSALRRPKAMDESEGQDVESGAAGGKEGRDAKTRRARTDQRAAFKEARGLDFSGRESS